ncbi:MAG: nucleotide exchange factor GrpE [Cyanobacteria bacterium M5B4]|nr:MAG: nucleotide exchange factor GrpE [Cyanobacteria bacterium M5B4]
MTDIVENNEELEELADDDEINIGELLEVVEAKEPVQDVVGTQEQQVPLEEVEALKQKHDQKVANLSNQILNLTQQLEEKENQYKRLYADFDNYRKRTLREKEEEEERITLKLIRRILPIVDDFERAQLQIKPRNEGESAIHNSYQSVYKQLTKTLKDLGVARMQVVGEAFDPNLQEAIAQEETTEFAEGYVAVEVRPGYLLGEKVLRHALVKVAIPPQEKPVGNEPING